MFLNVNRSVIITTMAGIGTVVMLVILGVGGSETPTLEWNPAFEDSNGTHLILVVGSQVMPDFQSKATEAVLKSNARNAEWGDGEVKRISEETYWAYVRSYEEITRPEREAKKQEKKSKVQHIIDKLSDKEKDDLDTFIREGGSLK